MVDYKTLRVPEPAWERAKEQKEAENRTWGEQIVRPDGESAGDGADEFAAAVESLETSLSVVEERTGRIERTLDELQR